MQIQAVSEGVFRIPAVGEDEDVLRVIRDISEAYQRARKKYDYITVTSSGRNAAYAILLAERFTPDAVCICPLTDGGEAFFRILRPFRRNLFAVLADVTVFVSKDDSPKDVRRLKRLLRLMRSDRKEITVLSDVAVKKQVLLGTNRKTLA